MESKKRNIASVFAILPYECCEAHVFKLINCVRVFVKAALRKRKHPLCGRHFFPLEICAPLTWLPQYANNGYKMKLLHLSTAGSWHFFVVVGCWFSVRRWGTVVSTRSCQVLPGRAPFSFFHSPDTTVEFLYTYAWSRIESGLWFIHSLHTLLDRYWCWCFSLMCWTLGLVCSHRLPFHLCAS